MSHNVSPTPATGIATSPRRRQQAIQPPNPLTTSLGNARNAGLGIGGFAQTPVSSTTLSSPFSGHPQSPYAQSPGGAMRGASPMALRSHGSFGGIYNPQQWGPVGNGSPISSSAGEHRQAQPSRVVALAPRPVGPDGKANPDQRCQHLLTDFQNLSLRLHHPIHLDDIQTRRTRRAVLLKSFLRRTLHHRTQKLRAMVRLSALQRPCLLISSLDILVAGLPSSSNKQVQTALRTLQVVRLRFHLRLLYKDQARETAHHLKIMQIDCFLP